MEEYAYILDIPPQKRGGRTENICLAVGDHDFKLFELVYKAGAVINFEDRVYIGKESAQRTVIDHVKRRIGFEELSSTAQSEIEYAVESAVKADEARFINFYNSAGPISLRKHMLEELPGLGKKMMQAILEERRRELYMEGDRWYELKRNGRPEWWIISGGLKYTTRAYLYTAPILKADVDLNPDLKQNPGYVY